MKYILSFILLVVLVAFIFRTTLLVIDRFPNDLGNSLWFVGGLALTIIILVEISNENFFKIHTNENHVMELDVE